MQSENSSGSWIFLPLIKNNDELNNWNAAFKTLPQNKQFLLSEILCGHQVQPSDFSNHFIKKMENIKLDSINLITIPAIRAIEKNQSPNQNFTFEGVPLIEKLSELQNPNPNNQEQYEDHKKRFNGIKEFLRIVTDNKNADIEIPHHKQTITVTIDKKVLPIESLGTGIHEVIILAAAATIHDKNVICIEEPELHLNPILQKKLMRYLQKETSNQYFITTHSAAIMDTPDAEIYHVSLLNSASNIQRVTSDTKRSEVCADLGYHPSDLLQTNCIIWVEGPSDRIYLNFWIRGKDENLIEGIHYSIMFYGGKLLSHLSGNEELAADDFILLRRLNRHSMIVIDSDKENNQDQINDTKRRIQTEFNQSPQNGYAWITDGREIENYLPENQILEAIREIAPNATVSEKLEKYDNCLKVKNQSNQYQQVSKIKVAHFITENKEPCFNRHDLEEQINKLITFIKNSNPST